MKSLHEQLGLGESGRDGRSLTWLSYARHTRDSGECGRLST
jgi:hypothetical protein